MISQRWCVIRTTPLAGFVSFFFFFLMFILAKVHIANDHKAKVSVPLLQMVSRAGELKPV